MQTSTKYIIKATATPVNHKLNITVISGIDLNVRTNGQIKTELNDSFYGDGSVYADISIGKKYGFNVSAASVTKFPGAKSTGRFL